MPRELGSSDDLLARDEPPAFTALRREGRGDFLIVVDHASPRIPRALANLGVSPSELQRHIGWDIGALAVALAVAEALDAPLVATNYSRLVIDCNRDPAVPTSIPLVSELTEIPGNRELTSEQKLARRRALFDPYHQYIHALLDERAAAGRPTILVAQHSMTNVFKGSHRDMHAAVLYGRDRRFAGLVLEQLRGETGLVVAENQPYFVTDESDHTIPRHGEGRGIPHVEIEIRQDLLLEEAGQKEWAVRITRALRGAAAAFHGATA